MDRLNAMGTFVQVVDGGSFSAAADRLGLSRAQVSKSVMQLEAHLDTRLLNRTTRRISLTDSGRLYYARCLDILDDIAEAEECAREDTTAARGVLTVGAPTSFGLLHLQPLIPAFLAVNPGVQISLSLADRFLDVVAEGFDVAVRIAELEDSSLVARRLAPCRRVLCASPAYLEKNGTPRVPQDLAIHACLVYSNELRPDTWTLHGPAGSERVTVNGPVCADNGDVLCAAAEAGLGVTLLPTFIVGDGLRAGRLVSVLDDYCPPDLTINAVYPSRRYLAAKVRSFVDYLAVAFAGEPSWDRAP
ncbi:MAG: LysR family transcriptional regulator [Gammaproteobacteria bacterium]|nr:LysR family transcriptional regulator [Gammaproteobacteria bacterium]